MDKLNVVLAVTDQLRSKYKKSIDDLTKFCTKSQGSFKGEKRTYTPREGTIDEPGKRGITRVVTTVDEKIEFFIKESENFIDALFSQENTNSLGRAEAKLEVNGEDWGTYTSLELLRLKSLVESSDLGNLTAMLMSIPVRSDSEVWVKSNDPDYADRDVYQTERVSGINKTTTKEEYILQDPNLKTGMDYTPMKGIKNKVVELGDYTRQNFSGEWSHQQRAMALKRKSDLLAAITIALKKANDCVAEKSDLNARKIFEYIFYGN